MRRLLRPQILNGPMEFLMAVARYCTATKTLCQLLGIRTWTGWEQLPIRHLDWDHLKPFNRCCQMLGWFYRGKKTALELRAQQQSANNKLSVSTEETRVESSETSHPDMESCSLRWMQMLSGQQKIVRIQIGVQKKAVNRSRRDKIFVVRSLLNYHQTKHLRLLRQEPSLKQLQNTTVYTMFEAKMALCEKDHWWNTAESPWTLSHHGSV